MSVLAVGAFLRLYDLPLAPLHHDEGVNGNFLVRLVRDGFYQYDPGNYHGPTLYYFAAVIPWTIRFLFGVDAQNAYGLTTFNIRLVTALFGLGTIWLVLLLRRHLGSVGALSGAALLAVSPGAVYLSRYFIHESLFVFFTFAIVVAGLRYYEEGHPVYLILLAASLGLLFATKETWIISVGVLIIALLSSAVYRWLVGWLLGTNEDRKTNPRLSKRANNARDRLVAVRPLLFSFQGRIPRGAFLAVMLNIVVLGAIMRFLALIAGFLLGTSIVKGSAWGVFSSLLLLMLGLALSILCGWVGLAMQVKRWHDIGYSGWMVLINLIPILGGLISLAILGIVKGGDEPNKYGETLSEWPKNDVLLVLWFQIGVVVFSVIGILFYSSFGTNWKGVYDSLKTFDVWTKTGKTAHVHERWTYVAKWLPFQESPLLVLGAIGAALVVWQPKNRFALFAALWAFGIIAAYSLVPYKTPWLMLNFIVPLALISGYAIEWAYQQLKQQELGKIVVMGAAMVVWVVVSGVLPNAALAFFHKPLNPKTAIPLYQTVDLNFVNYDNDNDYYVYVYAHTRRDLLKLVADIDRIARRTDKPSDLGITIVSPEYWPLPWYFRDYQRVGYYARMSASTEPVIIASETQRVEAEATFGTRYRQVQSGLNPKGSFALRPGVDLLLYLRRDLPDP